MTAEYLSGLSNEDAPDAWQLLSLINSVKPLKKLYKFIKLKKLSGLTDNICYWATSSDGIFWFISSALIIVKP